MSNNLADIIAKGLGRLTKIAEKEKAVREGKPLRIATALKKAAATQKSLENMRAKYIKSIVEGRDEVLSKELPIAEVRDGQIVNAKGIEQFRAILNDGWKKRAILSFEILILDIKEYLAENDIDNVCLANEAFEDFNEGLQEYMQEVIAKSQEINKDDIKGLWNTCLDIGKVKTLTRTSTVCDAIDVFKYTAMRTINAANTPDEVNGAVDTFIREVSILAERWGIKFDVNEIHNA